MAGEDCQDNELFYYRDSDDDDVEEGNDLSVHGSAESETAEAPESETAEAPAVHDSPAATESPVINITSSPIVATDEQDTISRVDEEQEHFPLPST